MSRRKSDSDSSVVATDRLTVVVAPGHPWARRGAGGAPPNRPPRQLRAVWPVNGRLIGPGRDLFGIAVRSDRPFTVTDR